MSADRFVIKANADLVAAGFIVDDDEGWSVFDSLTNRVIGSDGGEPEDQLLIRDWKWVIEALNAVDRELTTYREMDNARIAGYEAHSRGVPLNENPDPHFGDLSYRADAWDTGWLLAAGNVARRELDAANARAERADGLFEQASADRDRLKQQLQESLLERDALKLLLDRAADVVEIAANQLPEDHSAREVIAELRKAAAP